MTTERQDFSRLSPEQYRQFEDQGYVMIPDVFTPGDLEPLRREIDDLVGRHAAELQSEGKLDATFEHEPFETRLARIYESNPGAGEELLRRLKGKGGGGHAGPAMFNMIRHPKLLACIEDLIGPEIVGSSVYRIRPKLPGFAAGNVPWHQDSGYLNPHCDRFLIVTCWIPLIDATPETGCLSVLPGAHRSGIVRHHTGGNANFLVIEDADLPPGDADQVPVPLGGVLFMTNLTPHCSTPNTSGLIRWSIDLRYQSADVPNNVEEAPDDFLDGRPEVEIACYPPEADFVIQSPTHPEKEVRELADFEALRRRFEEAKAAWQLRWYDDAD